MLSTVSCLLVIAGMASASISGHIDSGTCVCATSSGLHARSGAGLSDGVVATLSHGECYRYNGGTVTRDGYHWYELQDVQGHHRAWVVGNYLSVSSAFHCSGSSATTKASFAHGAVSQHCLQCICDHESGCRPLGCKWDVNSNSCGYFQLKAVYWEDCGRPGGSLSACASDLHCSSQCLQNYMSRYIGHSGCAHNCESYARIHNGGPAGCHHSNTLGYWGSLVQHQHCHASS